MTHSPAPPTLTREELADITGYKRGRDQFNFLERLGWSVTWNKAGNRAIVHRLWYEAHITGQQAANMSAPKFEMVNHGRKAN